MTPLSLSTRKLLTGVVASLVLMSGGAHGADYPNKPVQVILPYGPGPSDLLARTTAACMQRRVTQPFVVISKTGANGELAANFVKLAPPDGYTLLMAASATVTDLVTKQVPTFDIRKDLEPITKLVFGVQGIYVSSQLPVSSVAELVAYAKARPGELNYATTGIGSVNHLSTEALSQVAGIRMIHIPYPQGTGAFLAAMMANEIQVATTDVGGAQAALDSGKIRLIGTLTKERMASRPSVPAVVETLPDMAIYTGTLWYGFFAPPKTPADIIQKANSDLVACLKDEDVRSAFRKVGYEDSQIIGNKPEEFRASILEDVTRLKEVVQRANIQLR